MIRINEEMLLSGFFRKKGQAYALTCLKNQRKDKQVQKQNSLTAAEHMLTSCFILSAIFF